MSLNKFSKGQTNSIGVGNEGYTICESTEIFWSPASYTNLIKRQNEQLLYISDVTG